MKRIVGVAVVVLIGVAVIALVQPVGVEAQGLAANPGRMPSFACTGVAAGSKCIGNGATALLGVATGSAAYGAIWLGSGAAAPTGSNDTLVSNGTATYLKGGSSLGLMANTSTWTITAGSFSVPVGATIKLDNATASACSTCDSGTRGRICFVAGGAGVKDIVTICAKDAGNAYAERTIY